MAKNFMISTNTAHQGLHVSYKLSENKIGKLSKALALTGSVSFPSLPENPTQNNRDKQKVKAIGLRTEKETNSCSSPGQGRNHV